MSQMSASTSRRPSAISRLDVEFGGPASTSFLDEKEKDGGMMLAYNLSDSGDRRRLRQITSRRNQTWRAYERRMIVGSWVAVVLLFVLAVYFIIQESSHESRLE